jgi:predicted Zn finger-like uncharacterized protein
MMIQCKKCGKHTKIDDSKIVRDRMRFKCPNCKGTIEVLKPTQNGESLNTEPAISPTFTENSSVNNPSQQSKNTDNMSQTHPSADWETKHDQEPKAQKTTGLTISKKLLYLFLAFIFITGTVLSLVYLKYVPALMHDQINLRTYSISRSFSAAIQQPFLVKDYLLVNKTAETNAGLPGVAYISVIDKKGILISGILGDNTRFSADFVKKVKEEGFPKEISTQNKISAGEKKSASDLILDGQKIHDVAVKIGDTEGEAHVGIFTEDVEKAVQKSLIPLLLILAIIAFLGYLSFLMVARTISTPIRLLTQAAEKISLGEIDLPIEVRGGGEIGELAASLERMRFSIKIAINRLRQK